jgi:hypothetical protein
LWGAEATDNSLVTLKDRDDRQVMNISRSHRDTQTHWAGIFISYLRFKRRRMGKRDIFATLQEFYTMNDDNTKAEDNLRMLLYVSHDIPK